MKNSKSNQGKMRSMCIIASTALFLFVPRLSVAQSAYPGFWTRVTLPQFPFILDFGFADTLNGVFEANDGTLGFTTDGEEILGAGQHFFYFSAKDLPSGTYYYTIEFPQGVVIANKTMLVVK